ncbi:MAG: spore Coat Protein domain protein [Bradyrhizobium sp.]|nr:spore Coat Protein domain protein [Bradyrhizobium sp.]
MAKILAVGAGMLIYLATAYPAEAATCSISPQGPSFGSYDTLSPSAVESVGNISVACDATTSFTIALDTGIGSFAQRTMAGNAVPLRYNLYVDATRLIVWGDGSGSTGTVSSTATGGNFAVYGRIPAGQNVTAGSYSDTIVVTISY